MRSAPAGPALRSYALAALAATALSLPVTPVRWHFFLFSAGLVLFAGNLLVSAAWMAWAQTSGDPKLIVFATRAAAKADLWFTGPGLVLILMNGLSLSSARWQEWLGYQEETWLTGALILGVLAAFVWGAFIWRYQIEMAQLRNPRAPRFEALVRRRVRWSTAAVPLPVVALFLTLARPTLW